MGKKDKLIAVARFNTELNRYLDTDYDAFITGSAFIYMLNIYT